MIRVPTLKKWAVRGDTDFKTLVELAEEERKVYVMLETARGKKIDGDAKLVINGCDTIYAVFDHGVWHALYPEQQRPASAFEEVILFMPARRKKVATRMRPLVAAAM